MSLVPILIGFATVLPLAYQVVKFLAPSADA